MEGQKNGHFPVVFVSPTYAACHTVTYALSVCLPITLSSVEAGDTSFLELLYETKYAFVRKQYEKLLI